MKQLGLEEASEPSAGAALQRTTMNFGTSYDLEDALGVHDGEVSMYERPRRASLDGIRGLATLMILVLHHSLFNAGWLALEIFFVLSGYLITSSLRRTREDEFFWREFWIKRLTRICPPLLLVLITVKLIFHVSLWRVAGYFLSLGDVLEYSVPFAPLGPLWSLAIEEHFYMLWPIAVRLLTRRPLLLLLGLAIAGEPLLRLAMCIFTKDWRVYYYLTPFRLDGLALGCLLAVLTESERGIRFVTWVSLPCCALISGLWFAFRFSLGAYFTRPNASYGYNGLAYSIVSMGSFGLLGFVLTHPESKLSSFLSGRFLTFTGSISYGMYCYQLVIRELTTTAFHLKAQQAFLIDLPITYLLGWLSFRFYERPIIAWGRRKATAIRIASPNFMRVALDRASRKSLIYD